MRNVIKLEHGLYNFAMKIPIANKLFKMNGCVFEFLFILYRKNPLYPYLVLKNIFTTYRNYDKNTILGTLNNGEKIMVRKKYIYDDIHIVNETLVEKCYGGGVLSSTLQNIKNKVVIDIGANIGDTAIFYGLMGANVYSYEPEINLFELAKRNIAINNLCKNVHIYNMGVGDKDGKFKLIVDKKCSQGGAKVSFDNNNILGGYVSIISFRKVIEDFESIHILKIDCEGCEYKIIEQTPCSDLMKVENYVMELHGEPESIIDKLTKCGYRVICGANDGSLPNSIIFASKNI